MAVTDATKVGDALKMDCEETFLKLKGEMEEASMAIKQNSMWGHERNGGETREKEVNVTKTYADRVKANVPTTHIMAVSRAEVQKKKIRLVRVAGMGREGLCQGNLQTKRRWDSRESGESIRLSRIGTS